MNYAHHVLKMCVYYIAHSKHFKKLKEYCSIQKLWTDWASMSLMPLTNWWNSDISFIFYFTYSLMWIKTSTGICLRSMLILLSHPFLGIDRGLLQWHHRESFDLSLDPFSLQNHHEFKIKWQMFYNTYWFVTEHFLKWPSCSCPKVSHNRFALLCK